MFHYSTIPFIISYHLMRSVFNLRRFYYTRIPFGFLKVSYTSEWQRAGINADIHFWYQNIYCWHQRFSEIILWYEVNVGSLINKSTFNTWDVKWFFKFELQCTSMMTENKFHDRNFTWNDTWIIALWLTRRWGLYDGTCPNLLRGDKAPILLPSYRKAGLL